MINFIKFLVITIVVILAGDYYFEYAVARDLFPPTLIAVFTGLFTIMIICYIAYIVKMLQKILNINKLKKEEKQ